MTVLSNLGRNIACIFVVITAFVVIAIFWTLVFALSAQFVEWFIHFHHLG
jgi:hypothetical protein